METTVQPIKISGTVISKNRAQEICSNWHGGQWSALYQFASSKVWVKENHLLYLEEIEQCINAPETALHPYSHTQSNLKELKSIKRFFLFKGQENGLPTVYTKDKYGYPFPQLHESVSDEIANTLKEIKRMQ